MDNSPVPQSQTLNYPVDSSLSLSSEESSIAASDDNYSDTDLGPDRDSYDSDPDYDPS